MNREDAIWLLYLLDHNFEGVAIWVGLIALAGLDAATGVVMLLYLTSRTGAGRSKGAWSTDTGPTS